MRREGGEREIILLSIVGLFRIFRAQVVCLLETVTLVRMRSRSLSCLLSASGRMISCPEHGFSLEPRVEYGIYESLLCRVSEVTTTSNSLAIRVLIQ